MACPIFILDMEIIMKTNKTNKKSGVAKFETLVKACKGKIISVKRIMGYTGLSKNSVVWYASFEQFGKIKNEKLHINGFRYRFLTA